MSHYYIKQLPSGKWRAGIEGDCKEDFFTCEEANIWLFGKTTGAAVQQSQAQEIEQLKASLDTMTKGFDALQQIQLAAMAEMELKAKLKRYESYDKTDHASQIWREIQKTAARAHLDLLRQEQMKHHLDWLSIRLQDTIAEAKRAQEK